MRLCAAAVAIVASILTYGPAGAAESKPPYELVRSLNALQDQMVVGNRAARAAVPQLAAELEKRLLAYDPKVWREPRNVRAAVTYVLSGGSPRVMKAVLASGNCSQQEKKLVEATIAYSEGRAGRARALLASVDPRTLEPILGAHVALVQAGLVADKDPEKAVALLDVARVLAPGTLVEEAALRREIFLINATGDFDRFIDLSGEYIRRFLNSTYADNFRGHFSDAIARLDITGDSDQLRQIDDVLGGLKPDDQLKLYLMIARASVLRGKIAAAQFAAAKAEALASPETVEIQRAELYDGAAEIFTPEYERGDSLLGSLDTARLPREEGMLKDAALSMSGEIHQWPSPPSGASDMNPPRQTVPAGLEAVMQNSSATIDAAKKALAESDDPKAALP
jgi:chemotaxis protein MotC